MRVNSSCEHPPPGKPLGIPRVFEKIVQMTSPAGNFCLQMPHPPFVLWWSNARPPSLSGQHIKLFVAVFNKHNCFSSIELHKTGHKMSHFDWKKDKANGFFVFVGLLWSINALHLLQNDNAWLLKTLDSERRQKWQQDVTKQVFCCVQMPGGPGHYQLPNARTPGLIVQQLPRVSPAGGCSRVELTHTLLWTVSENFWRFSENFKKA